MAWHGIDIYDAKQEQARRSARTRPPTATANANATYPPVRKGAECSSHTPYPTLLQLVSTSLLSQHIFFTLPHTSTRLFLHLQVIQYRLLCAMCYVQPAMLSPRTGTPHLSVVLCNPPQRYVLYLPREGSTGQK